MVRRLVNYLEIAQILVTSGDSSHELGPVDAVFFSHDNNRGESLQGRAWNRLEDPIAGIWRAMGFSEARIAYPYSRLGDHRAHGSPALINRSAIKKRFSARIQGYREEPSPASIEMYSRLLRRTNPRLVFTMNLPPALPTAARSLDIPVVEVVHGKGYATIPWGWADVEREQLPNAAMTFDALSAQTFGKLGPRGVRNFYVQDPWVKIFLDDPSSLPREWLWPRELSDGWDRVVLLTLQWEGHAARNPEEPSSNLLENTPFLRTLESVFDKTVGDTLWLLRLHPVQLRQARYGWMRQRLDRMGLGRPNLEWQRASTLPLPAVLQASTHHMSMRSGSTYEAAMMGVPTALISTTLNPGNSHSDAFSDLREAGYVRLLDISKEDSVLDWLKSERRKRPLVAGCPVTVEACLRDLTQSL